MQTELNIDNKYNENILYVICKKNRDSDVRGWLHHHTYTDLEKAKEGLKKLLENNPYNLEYKIKKFVIKGIDLITDEMFPLIENLETHDCFHCGKMIQAGDEIVFGQSTEEIYCSHLCASESMGNEYWTAFDDQDEYLPWFPEK